MEGLLGPEDRAKIDQLRASFAKPGEKWLTNATVQSDWLFPKPVDPNTKAEAIKAREQQLRERYRDHDLRFDYEHLVSEWGGVHDSSGFSEKVAGIKGGVFMAVYGKPKPTQA